MFFLQLRNIQALLEAEAEAKLHMHSSTTDSSGGCSNVGNNGTKQLLSTGSFEHLNLLSSLNNGPSVLAVNKNFPNGLLSASASANNNNNNKCSADLENINPHLFTMNGARTPSGDFSGPVFGPSKFGNMFKSGQANLPSAHQQISTATSDEDEKIFFSNSMLLETCLLKVWSFNI